MFVVSVVVCGIIGIPINVIWFEKDMYRDTFLLYRFTQKHSYVSVYVRELLHTIDQKHIFCQTFNYDT